jgi:hypothetical protein
MLAMEKAIVPMTPNEDQTLKEGYGVVASAGKAALCTGVQDEVFGVIMDGGPTTGKSAVAVAGSGLVVHAKLDGTPGTVVAGSYLAITATGTFKLDPATGNRIRCARAIEAGSANELIKAVLVATVQGT